MKKANTLHWIFTGLFSAFMLLSAIPDIMVIPVAVNGFKEIQLPAYLVPFVGVAKVLGVLAILIPGYPRIKEWAYAGLMFDLLGAIYCIACGKSVADGLPVLLPIIIGICACIFYHKRLKAVSL